MTKVYKYIVYQHGTGKLFRTMKEIQCYLKCSDWTCRQRLRHGLILKLDNCDLIKERKKIINKKYYHHVKNQRKTA